MIPLRRRMIQDMQLRNYALNTQKSYVEKIESFARHFGTSPEHLGPEEVRRYQMHLLFEKTTSISICLAVGESLRLSAPTTTTRHSDNLTPDGIVLS